MEDADILERISALVDEEHRLRGQPSGTLGEEQRARLQSIEHQLDQCWDLLRRRRAREEFGLDPSREQPRPEGEVESYLQ